jgi:hypothetical protein
MPNWTYDDGFSDFGKLSCGRCMKFFNMDKRGEVPEHECIGGRYRSESNGLERHRPVKVE